MPANKQKKKTGTPKGSPKKGGGGNKNQPKGRRSPMQQSGKGYQNFKSNSGSRPLSEAGIGSKIKGKNKKFHGTPFVLDSRDPKTTVPLSEGNRAVSQSSSNIVSPPINYKSIQAIVLPILTNAYQAGINIYSSLRGKPGIPFYSAMYCVSILEKYVQNSQALTIKVPKWLAIFGNALRPKNVGFKSGSVEYQWQYEPQSNNYQPIVQLSPSNASIQTNFYFNYPTSEINATGYMECETSIPAYTDALGQESFGILVSFFNDRDYPMWELVDIADGGQFTKDVSAFAYPSPVLGYGQGAGAWGLVAGNEVPILHPLLGVFASSNQLVRYPKQYRNVAGDPLVASALLHMTNNPSLLKMKNQIVFKGVDFNQFADVYFRWIVKLFEGTTASSVQSLKQPNLGVSFQDLMIALRSLFVYNFGVTQGAVQGMFPRIPINVNDNVFVPFAVGSNCFPCDDAAELLLPTLMIENARALGARITTSSINPNTGKPDLNNPQIYMPVLGVFSEEKLDPDTYLYKDAEGIYTSIFGSADPMTINLCDGTAQSPSGTPLQISKSGLVSNTVAKVNDILRTLATYSMPMDTIGDICGINALTLIAMTDVRSNFAADNVIYKRKVVHMTDKIQENRALALKRKDSKLKAVVPAACPYDTESVTVTTSQVMIVKNAWTEIQKYWIKPVSARLIGTGPVDNTDQYVIATYANEPFSIVYEESDEADYVRTSITTNHNIYASVMIKGAMGEDPIIVTQLKEWARQGRGGILGALVGKLATILPF